MILSMILMMIKMLMMIVVFLVGGDRGVRGGGWVMVGASCSSHHQCVFVVGLVLSLLLLLLFAINCQFVVHVFLHVFHVMMDDW